jgi:hypothetical protein
VSCIVTIKRWEVELRQTTCRTRVNIRRPITSNKQIISGAMETSSRAGYHAIDQGMSSRAGYRTIDQGMSEGGENPVLICPVAAVEVVALGWTASWSIDGH